MSKNKFEGGELGEGQGVERFASPSSPQAEETLAETTDAYGLDIEALRTEFRPFVADRLRTIYNQAIITPEFISGEISLEKPEHAQYASKDGSLAKSPFGALTLNPATQHIDWNKVPDSAFSAFEFGSEDEGRKVGEVLQEFVSSPILRASYNLDAYELLGAEFWKWLCEHGVLRDRVPSVLSSVPFILAGSRIGSNVGWEVPYVVRNNLGPGDSFWVERLVNLDRDVWTRGVFLAKVRKSALDEARLRK